MSIISIIMSWPSCPTSCRTPPMLRITRLFSCRDFWMMNGSGGWVWSCYNVMVWQKLSGDDKQECDVEEDPPGKNREYFKTELHLWKKRSAWVGRSGVPKTKRKIIFYLQKSEMNVALTWKRQARDQDHRDRLRYNHQPWDHDDGQEFVTSSRSFIRNLPETIAITSQAVFHLASSSAFCPLSISKILPRAASMLAFSPETFVEATEWTSAQCSRSQLKVA